MPRPSTGGHGGAERGRSRADFAPFGSENGPVGGVNGRPRRHPCKPRARFDASRNCSANRALGLHGWRRGRPLTPPQAANVVGVAQKTRFWRTPKIRGGRGGAAGARRRGQWAQPFKTRRTTRVLFTARAVGGHGARGTSARGTIGKRGRGLVSEGQGRHGRGRANRVHRWKVLVSENTLPPTAFTSAPTRARPEARASSKTLSVEHVLQ